MSDHHKTYMNLFYAIADAIAALQLAQEAAEELYLAGEPHEDVPKDGDEGISR